jgi:diguanylate cyclase (GGDEF)-like protein/PAS domain S-box-containing protein
MDRLFLKLSRKTVYFLGLLTFAVLAAWLSYFIYQGSLSLYQDAERAITQLQVKREAITGMMRSARERSVVLLEMSIEKDVFKRDELRFRLDRQAAVFIVFRSLFEKQPLTPEESKVFYNLLEMVFENVPILDQVADLLIADELEEARKLLIDVAMPNQNRIFLEFEKVINLIEENSRYEIEQLKELLQKNNQLTFQLAFLVVGGSFVVFLIIHALSLRREKELQQLIAERTRELESAHIKTRSLVENASDGIISIDQQQHIVLFNPAAEHMFGYSKEEALGQSITILLPGKEKDAHQAYVNGFANDRSVQSRMMNMRPEVMGKRKDGSVFPAEVSISKYLLGESMYFTAFVRDTTKQREAEAEIRRLALCDSLTGLANRHHFESRLKESISYQKRFPDQRFRLMLLDLDLFKQVNDTYGHPVGDALLKRVAELLKSHVREIDDVGRLGGDEFAILLQGGMTAKEAEIIAEKLIETLSIPLGIEGHSIQIGVSIGITECPENDANMDILFRQADQALYAAKHAGRNTYRLFS